MLDLLLLMLPVFGMAFPILANIASSKLSFLYRDARHKIGFDLKKRTWGVSYRDAKKIAKFTKDASIQQKALAAIRLWKIAYFCLFIFFILWFIIGCLNLF